MPLTSQIALRNNANLGGNPQGRPMVFAHGYGCDQTMWRYVVPAFEEEYKTVLFDHVGAGGSDLSAYDRQKYDSLQGYANDIIEICRELDLEDVVYVGHSVASMMGVLAAIREPELFHRLILIGPSPRYINDDQYRGGFSSDEIDELVVSTESNYLGWSAQMAPLIMGNEDRPELGEELTNRFCSTDPEIAAHFAAVTFKSDNRSDLGQLEVPALVMQCSDDIIASEEVGRYVHEQLKNSEYIKLDATGHCPNLSAPQETIQEMKAFLSAPH